MNTVRTLVLAHDDILRTRLLECALRLLRAKGKQGLTLRQLAADAGTSTTAVYALFGSKRELFQELYRVIAENFTAHLTGTVTTNNPTADVLSLGLAYRKYALAEPELYLALMDNSSIVDSVTEPIAAVVATAVHRTTRTDTAELTIALIALLRGLISMELSGNLKTAGSVTDFYCHALQAQLHGWQQNMVIHTEPY